VSCPGLVVRGELSPLTTVAGAAAVARRLGARVVEIPGGGHDLGVERPEPVADAVRDFLDHRSPTAARS
jgi:pimeloyl-ACP methyl ester carboxylesterase